MIAILICFVATLPPYFFEKEIGEAFIARSNLPLPSQMFFLERSELLKKIKHAFKNKSDIRTVALVGAGGAGKTTIARSFLRSTKAPIVWEFNAETLETLRESFQDLAQALAISDEDKDALASLRKINDAKKQEKLLIQFVQGYLRKSPEWVLHYDNVVNIISIEPFFPMDPNTWGKGRVVITTQDANVSNSKQVTHSIRVEKLTKDQKKELLSKVLFHEISSDLYDKFDLEGFVDKIPSFPLDVIIAANYIRATSLSPEEYLKRLESMPTGFEEVQKDILQEVTDYKKTRYGIVTLALKKLIMSHEDFQDLILFISLLNSQNIPRDLLESYKNKIIVDNFIHHMKKYSLITNESPGSEIEGANFSIHRSTQVIALNYLQHTMSGNDLENKRDEFTKILGRYASESVLDDDFTKIKLLIKHCEALYHREEVLDECSKGLLLANLSFIHQYTSTPSIKQSELQKAIKSLNNCKINSMSLARAYTHLGYTYWKTGEYQTAKSFFEKSLKTYDVANDIDFLALGETYLYFGILSGDMGGLNNSLLYYKKGYSIYKQHFPKQYSLQAIALLHLGYAYVLLQRYIEGEKFLKMSLDIFEKLHEKKSSNRGYILYMLGDLYSKTGYVEKAEECCKRGYEIYQNAFSKKSLSFGWGVWRLGCAYSSSNKHKKAIKFLERAVEIYRENLGAENIKTHWVLLSLATAYINDGELNKAKKLLEQGLKIYEKTYGRESYHIAYVLMQMGKVYLLEDKIDLAESFFIRALKTYQNNDRRAPFLLEEMSNLYLKKSLEAEQNRDLTQVEKYREEAKAYLIEALKDSKELFPHDSPHIDRIQSKLKKIKGNTP